MLNRYATIVGYKTFFDTSLSLFLVRQAITKGVKVDNDCGYVTVDYDTFFKLPHSIALNLIYVLLQFVRGKHLHLSTKKFNRVYREFKGQVLTNNINLGLCNIFKDGSTKKHLPYFFIARSMERRYFETEPIKLGETVHWDDRFLISLMKLPPDTPGAGSPKEGEEFFIAPWKERYNLELTKGVRKRRTFKLPPPIARQGLPVIVDKDGRVVLIPHFKVVDRSYGVTCSYQFKPNMSLYDWVDWTPMIVDNEEDNLDK